MHISSLPAAAAAPDGALPAVGRLVPLDGLAPRPHPDRTVLLQFLGELRLPLAAMQSLLELAQGDAPPEARAMAVDAAAEHTGHLLSLVDDFVAAEQIAAGMVVAAPRRLELVPWIGDLVAGLARSATEDEQLRVLHRSFLPSDVELDPVLAQLALEAVLRVARQRAAPGPIELRIAYVLDRSRPARSRLSFEFATRGGGFTDLEQGYVFTPFRVRDAAARPLLGLGIAHRRCQLLGGELTVHSPSLAACRYTAAFAVAPLPGARWVDPFAPFDADLGPVRPGSILFVGAGGEVRRACTPVLRRAGYRCDLVDALPADAARPTGDWDALVLAGAVDAAAAAAMVAGWRSAGARGPVVAVAASGDAGPPWADVVLRAPFDGERLLASLRRWVPPAAADARR